ASTELAGGISTVPGCAPSRSGGVATKFDASAVVGRSADGPVDVSGQKGAGASSVGAPAPVDADAGADAAGVFHVSDAAVSAPDRAGALASRTSRVAASDAPEA